jgi:DNA-binding NarL/FixJ family response regulator
MKIGNNIMKQFSALIIEDQELVRQGVTLVLQQHFVNVRVHQSGNGIDALLILDKHKVDIVLLDIGLPGMTGVELAEIMIDRYPEVKILVVTQFNGEAMIKNLFRKGIHSFFFKTNAAHEIEGAVNAVLSGQHYLPDSIKAALIPTTHIPVVAFNKREGEILLQLKMGRSSKQISQRLNLKENTVNSYREAMLQKTGTANVAQLISYAYENGILG